MGSLENLVNKILLFIFFTFPLLGQQDSTTKSILGFYAYAEGYYLVDPIQKTAHEKEPIFFNHAHANQWDLNLGILGISLKKGPFNAQISGMLGSYARRNLANEPTFWRNVFEMNISYQLAKNWSIMAGVFPSHLGYESVKNSDNWTLSRSFIAENSPYYESGISINFKPNASWSYTLLGLRGWQRIHELRPAIGTQIIYTSANSWIWNSSGFIGNEGNGTRLFHDFYVVVPLSKKIKAVLISDLGYQHAFWHGEALMVQAKLSETWKLAGRLEQFSDPNAIILAPESKFQSASINTDFRLFPKMMLRAEWRIYQSSNNSLNINSPEYIFSVVLGK
ncbi:outer membrane beta-barrel protein [Aquirufa sp. Wall-65K1]